MKILLLGDTHLRYRGPSSRTDDFFRTQYNKFCAVLDVYKTEGCSLLLQAGDLFNSPRPPNILLSAYITALRSADVVIHCVLGQHDISMHSLESVERSAISVMISAGVLEILDDVPLEVGDQRIYGASFSQTIPKPSGDAILVVHEMIGDKQLWSGHELINPDGFLVKHSGYKLILCGDYHYRFLADTGERTIVNVGCLVRQTCSVMDRQLKPACAVYDTDTRCIGFHEISHQSSDEVFYKQFTKEDACDESVMAFIDRLRADDCVQASFRDNLNRFFEIEKTDPKVRDLILQVVEEHGNESG